MHVKLPADENDEKGKFQSYQFSLWYVHPYLFSCWYCLAWLGFSWFQQSHLCCMFLCNLVVHISLADMTVVVYPLQFELGFPRPIWKQQLWCHSRMTQIWNHSSETGWVKPYQDFYQELDVSKQRKFGLMELYSILAWMSNGNLRNSMGQARVKVYLWLSKISPSPATLMYLLGCTVRGL